MFISGLTILVSSTKKAENTEPESVVHHQPFTHADNLLFWNQFCIKIVISFASWKHQPRERNWTHSWQANVIQCWHKGRRQIQYSTFTLLFYLILSDITNLTRLFSRVCFKLIEHWIISYVYKIISFRACFWALWMQPCFYIFSAYQNALNHDKIGRERFAGLAEVSVSLNAAGSMSFSTVCPRKNWKPTHFMIK